MTRWAPGTPERLQEAALALFADRGYEQTTAADIARSVGVTERTFFRHFSDKREVLFEGQRQLTEAFVTGATSAPADTPPLEIVAGALRAAAAVFPDGRRPYARARQAVIERNPALQERELHKLAGLAATLTESLRARGVAPLTAALAAQSGITVFGLAFTQWIAEGEERSFEAVTEHTLTELLTLTAGAAGAARRDEG
ncbi:TetR/AcrR family transcriptional regulator [Streptomyces sp. NPDC058417]|uniref:TetR/AcrR family transcriptional regulator n=1 Tax=unclassified Streptomyces TaxID=2593676 RepID=UPI003669621B